MEFAVLICFILICICAVILTYYVVYKSEIMLGEEDVTIIPFRSFKQFYLLNPNRWNISKKNYVECKTYDRCWDKFYFSFIGWIRYRFFLIQLKRHEANERSAIKLYRMIDAVKKDIKDINDKSEKEIDIATKFANNYMKL